MDALHRTHFAPLDSDYTVCGRYVFNSLTLHVTSDPELSDCGTCKKEIRRRAGKETTNVQA